MKNLLQFFIRYYFIILFILLETFGIILLIQHNTYQKAQLVNITHTFIGGISNKFASIRDYSSLRKENRQLIEENNRLYNLLKNLYRFNAVEKFIVNDSLYQQQYLFISAKVINNSTNKQYNYITLNKGKNDGIEKEMAVICNNGIIGIVKEVSNNFSSVLSFLNRLSYISAKIKNSEYINPGPLVWDGKNYRYGTLKDIPHHVKITIGDTIITSGYSATFPEGILIGIISDYSLKGGNYYEIKVKLSTDFKNLRNVQVIKNLYRKEQKQLEKSAQND